MQLLAETGGKNATIVTTLSDRDQAIKHVLHSAFSHGGQKCSATSLLILEEEVYQRRRIPTVLVRRDSEPRGRLRLEPANADRTADPAAVRRAGDRASRNWSRASPGR